MILMICFCSCGRTQQIKMREHEQEGEDDDGDARRAADDFHPALVGPVRAAVEGLGVLEVGGEGAVGFGVRVLGGGIGGRGGVGQVGGGGGGRCGGHGADFRASGRSDAERGGWGCSTAMRDGMSWKNYEVDFFRYISQPSNFPPRKPGRARANCF